LQRLKCVGFSGADLVLTFYLFLYWQCALIMPQHNTEIKNTLRNFVSRFPGLSPKEQELVLDALVANVYAKGTLLVKPGDIRHPCFFVLKGCLRQYVLDNGIEKTTQFYTENETATLFSSFTGQAPSVSYLECCEESLLIVGEFGSERDMYQQVPALEQLTRNMMEQDFGKTQESLSRFITSNPEERYLYLQKNKPGLLQRVPQHQLASYIGVTPESLSRIRKRLAKKKS